MRPRLGVIPTNGRPCIDRAIRSLLGQVDQLVVIEAGSNITPREYLHEKITCIRDTSGEINISKWWNIGIAWAEKMAKNTGAATWDVVILNDDTEVPSSWVCYVADDMRALRCAAACSGGRGGSGPTLLRRLGPSGIRLLGCAFVLAGESGIRADEDMRWYYSDDSIDQAARQAGGVVVFPGCDVKHAYPNHQVSLEMQTMITEDATRFIDKWGFHPW